MWRRSRGWLALGDRLELHAPPADVDLAQVDAQLGLVPAERLWRHDAAARALRARTETASRVASAG